MGVAELGSDEVHISEAQQGMESHRSLRRSVCWVLRIDAEFPEWSQTLRQGGNL